MNMRACPARLELGTVLLVDDDPTQLLVAEAALRQAGFEVVSISDAGSAEAALERRLFDAVVLDRVMPERSGLDLLRVLRHSARNSAVPVLFLSALATAEERVRGLRAGADDYLTKPYDAMELALRVAHLVSSSRQPRLNGIQGSFEDWPCVEVLQAIESGSKSGRLTVSASVGAASLEVEQGRALSATYAGLTGCDAVLALLAETRGSFHFDSHAAPQERGHASALPALQSLVLEAGWLEDELERRRHGLPADDEPLQACLPRPAATAADPSLPLLAVWSRLGLHPGSTLDTLLAARFAAPQRVRLAVALLAEQGSIRRLRRAHEMAAR